MPEKDFITANLLPAIADWGTASAATTEIDDCKTGLLGKLNVFG
jgi:hypothetical protein